MSGTMVYGDLVHRIVRGNTRTYIQDHNGDMYPVDPDSVQQLIGYDKDKFAVWEGDELVDDEGNTYTAQLWGVVIKDGGVFVGTNLHNLSVKNWSKGDEIT